MKEIEIKLTGMQSLDDTLIKIDDKPIKFKKNQFGNLICKHQTDNDKVNIKIIRLLDVGGMFWFITKLFFFIISVFGLFDVHHKEKCQVIDFETEIYLKDENKLTLQLNNFQENNEAINIQTDLLYEQISNKYYLNTKAKKMLKRLKVAKIFILLAMIITIIALIIINL